MDAKMVLTTFEDEIRKYKALFFDKLREHTNDGWKLIYCIQGMSWESTFFLNMKFIFWFDEKMGKLTHNSITYLYRQDGEYQTVDLTDDMPTLINEILTHISQEQSNSEISDFAISGTDGFNQEFKSTGSDRFIQNLRYEPQGVAPSALTTFTFFLEEANSETELVLRYAKDEWIIIKPSTGDIDTTIEKGVSIDEIYKEVVNRLSTDS
jgi:hypothetical protein